MSVTAKHLVEVLGTPESQKNELVDMILDAFQNPQQWPMSDSDRIKLLKFLYERALRIKRTEQAIKEGK